MSRNGLPRTSRRTWTVAAAATALLALLVAGAPPTIVGLDPIAAPVPTVSGAFHVHTSRSDGAGEPNEVADAAARAGLDFVVFTDHGDATRSPAPPAYQSGVLMIDGVEISTAGGHYVALDMPASPYPLGGEARDVVEDVARLGGFGVAAHPTSLKPELAWREKDAPIDALEWLNADSEWRDETAMSLARALFYFPFRPIGATASLLDGSTAALACWDALSMRRPIVALAGHDAHGGFWEGDGGRWAPSPSYETLFKIFSTRIELERPLEGRADADASALLHALRRGRAMTLVDAIASPVALDFSVREGSRTARAGEQLHATQNIEVHVRIGAPPSGSELRLLRNGAVVTRSATSALRYEGMPVPGAYRVEVHAGFAPGVPPTPWVVSNPVYVNLPPLPASPAISRPSDGDPLVPELASASNAWKVERDPTSEGSVEVRAAPGGTTAVFRWRLGAGARGSQYAAIASLLSRDLSTYARLGMEAWAEGPMRLSVQLRANQSDDKRWLRSVHLDSSPRWVNLPFDEFRPATLLIPPEPTPVVTATALLMVVNTVNTAPGAQGVVYLRGLRALR